ncbi:hypothetical protein FB446DRAFT_255040 [Lentinula raphanica]|nr:hypothetical protein FB446DRAFT_255040 [Lentinula raphanica]
MPPDEQAQLAADAALYYFDVINIISSAIGIGMLSLGFALAVWYMRSDHWSHTKITLLICCSVILICSYWSVGYFGAYTMSSIHFVFVNQSNEIDLTPSLILDYINSWLPSIALVMGDLIVTWRAWILLQHNRCSQFVLAIFSIANLGLNAAACIQDTIMVRTKLVRTTSALDWLSNAASIVMNMCATLMIAWKAWAHSRLMKEYLGHTRRTYVNKVLLLLIESGALFCLVQLIVLAFTLVSTYSINAADSLAYQEAFAIIGTASTLAPAWYPIMVIILIQSDRSPVEQTLQDSHAHSEDIQN